MKTNQNGFSMDVDSLKITLNPQTKGNFVNVFSDTSNHISLLQEPMSKISDLAIIVNINIEREYKKLEHILFGKDEGVNVKYQTKETSDLIGKIIDLHAQMVKELEKTQISEITYSGAVSPISEVIRYHLYLQDYLKRFEVSF